MNEAPVITAFLDANVLYPALLRDILMRLASHGLFRARWSARVHEEWITALLRNRPDLTRARVEQAVLPDMFVLELLDNHQSEVIAALHRLRKSFKNPPHTAADLLANMKRHSLRMSADALGTFIDAL